MIISSTISSSTEAFLISFLQFQAWNLRVTFFSIICHLRNKFSFTNWDKPKALGDCNSHTNCTCLSCKFSRDFFIVSLQDQLISRWRSLFRCIILLYAVCTRGKNVWYYRINNGWEGLIFCNSTCWDVVKFWGRSSVHYEGNFIQKSVSSHQRYYVRKNK